MSQPNGYQPRHLLVEVPKHRADGPADYRPRTAFFTARHCAGDQSSQPMCDHLHPIPWAERPQPIGVPR